MFSLCVVKTNHRSKKLSRETLESVNLPQTQNICLFRCYGSATYERVPECTDGRVYVLQFKSSSARSFFWMQEPKEDKDDEICKTINDSIENPPPSGGGFGGLMVSFSLVERRVLSRGGGGSLLSVHRWTNRCSPIYLPAQSQSECKSCVVRHSK